ncbi:MAG: Phospholipase D-nuclease N-terminal [Flaviaesturariibacter sp.]|nr:Phospholipase D-nuclease N-terminal [Flaviaesturariibacter sp.]
MERLLPDATLVLFSLVLPLAAFLVGLVIFLRQKPVKSVDRIGWLLVMFFIPYLGPLLYLAVGRRKQASHIKTTNGIFQ